MTSQLKGASPTVKRASPSPLKNYSEEPEKRDVPSICKKIMAWDAKLTRLFYNQVSKKVPLDALQSQAFTMEIMCNGFLWIPGCLAIIWLAESKPFIATMTNLLLALLLDVIIVAMIKAFTRRQRPPSRLPGMLGQFGPDKFSFPSGHASRAFLVTFFFTYVRPIWPWPSVSAILFIFMALLWSSSVSVSRVLYSRHYILDVIAGIVIGILQAKLWTYLWIDVESAVNLLSWFTSME